MSSFRPEKVAEQIHKEISLLLMHGIKDPRVSSVTLTGVEVTRDLRQARVYFTVLGDDDDLKAAETGLRSASTFIRRALGKVIRLRHIPEIKFEYDQSIAHGQRIDELLRQVKDDLNDDSEDSRTD